MSSADTGVKETRGFQAEVKQLLQLMIHSLYSNKEIFLRELVSNASDACDRLRFEAIGNPALLEGAADFAIRVTLDAAARSITISDNGIGMSRDEAIAHLGTIAKSGTREFFAALTGDQQKDAQLIGQFGVGFYSAFIVAERVSVLSRRAGLAENETTHWESDGSGEYTIEPAARASRGTDVTLHLKADAEEFASGNRVRATLRKYSDHIATPIRMRKETWDKDKQAYVAGTEEERKKEEQIPEKEKPRTIVPRRLTGVAALIATIGDPGAEHLEYAAGLLAYLSPPIREALGDPVGAQAVMFGCLMDEDLTNRERQLRALRSRDQGALARKAEVIAPHLRQLDRAYRLPLVALATPALKRLDQPGRAAFLSALRAVILADERVALSEFVLATILDWTLGPKAKRSGAVRFNERGQLAAEISLTLSLLAHAGAPDPAKALAAFDKGKAVIALPELALAAKEMLQLSQVSEALERLGGLPSSQKERLLEAFAATAAVDDDIKLMEHELLRAVACVLDCPMPPAVAALDPRLLRK